MARQDAAPKIERTDGASITKDRKNIDTRLGNLDALRSKEDEAKTLREVDAEMSAFAGGVETTLSLIKAVDVKIGEKVRELENLYKLKTNRRPIDFEQRRTQLHADIDGLEAERSSHLGGLQLRFSVSMDLSQMATLEANGKGYAAVKKAARSTHLDMFVELVGEGDDGTKNQRVTGIRLALREKKYKWHQRIDVKKVVGSQDDAQGQKSLSASGSGNFGGSVAIGPDLRGYIKPPPGQVGDDGVVHY